MRALNERAVPVVTTLAVIAASWAVLMALAPLLQLRRMIQRGSSQDVSVGYLLILLPGFALWVLYGWADASLALVIPNLVALVVSGATTVVAVALRRRVPATS